MQNKIIKTEEEWKTKLSEDSYYVCRQKGTESPFSGKYNKYNEEGMYSCICCDNELFRSSEKYDSGSGWPSFYKTISERAIEEKEDASHEMKRIEITCKQCGSHLGHVF